MDDFTSINEVNHTFLQNDGNEVDHEHYKQVTVYQTIVPYHQRKF